MSDRRPQQFRTIIPDVLGIAGLSSLFVGCYLIGGLGVALVVVGTIVGGFAFWLGRALARDTNDNEGG